MTDFATNQSLEYKGTRDGKTWEKIDPEKVNKYDPHTLLLKPTGPYEQVQVFFRGKHVASYLREEDLTHENPRRV
jgi:hypothetical protein